MPANFPRLHSVIHTEERQSGAYLGFEDRGGL